MRYVSLAVFLISGVCQAQTPQPPVTADELQYLRFVLLNVGSVEHSPDAVQTFQDAVVKQFRLSAQEAAALRAAGQSLNGLLARHRQMTRPIAERKGGPSQADRALLANLGAECEQLIANLANQLLNTVGPAAAARLRAPGRAMAKSPGRPVK